MRKGLALFKETVRPVLVKHCLDCHGGKATKGDFDLSDRKALVDSGVLDGGSNASQLLAVIAHREEPFMPHKAPKLPDADIASIARWVDLGAPYDRPLTDKKAAGNVATAPSGPPTSGPSAPSRPSNPRRSRRTAEPGPRPRSTASSSPRSTPKDSPPTPEPSLGP